MKLHLRCPKNTSRTQKFTKGAITSAMLFGISTMSVATFSTIEAGASHASPSPIVASNIALSARLAYPAPLKITAPAKVRSFIFSNFAHEVRQIARLVSPVIGAMTRPIGNAIFTVGSTISKIGSNIGSVIAKTGTKLAHFIGPVASQIGTGISSIITKGTSAIGMGISTVGSAITTLADGASLLYRLSSNTPLLHEIGPSPEFLANAKGKIPVILLHGAFNNASSMLDYYDALEQAGIPTYAISVGHTDSLIGSIFPKVDEIAPINSSTQELSDFIDKVQAETKSPKVDLVGYSEGGLISRNYMVNDKKDNIEDMITLGGVDHGTTVDSLSSVLHFLPQGLQSVIKTAIAKIIGPAADDMLATSPLVQKLDSYPDTKAGVHYLSIGSVNDVVATPYQTTYLKAVPGADVSNIEVHSIPGVAQDFNHLLYTSDPALIKLVVQYIEKNGEPARSIPLPPRNPLITSATPNVDVLH